MQAVLGELRVDKEVDRGMGRRGRERLETPVILRIVERHRVHPVRPDRALGDPAGEDGDLVSGKRAALRRHDLVIVVGREEVDERAFLRLSWLDVRTMTIPALHRRGFHIEAKSRLPRVSAVAVVAMHFKDGTHVADEVNGGGVGGRDRENSKTTRYPHDLRAFAAIRGHLR